jgi:undecaprenyl-diphosphatase
VYLTLGALLARTTKRWHLRVFYLTLAFALTVLVGLTRLYLGVHYPTDVLAGWIVGLFWASLCWLAAQHYEVRAGLRAEKGKANS